MNSTTLKTGFLFSCLLWTSITSSTGQEVTQKWSLIPCIRYAIVHNLNNRLNQLNRESAAIDLQQAGLNRLPTLSAETYGEFSFGRSLDPNTNDVINTKYFYNNEYLYSATTLFQGFVLHNQIAYSRFLQDQSRWQKIDKDDQLAFSVLTDFYNVVYFQGTVTIAREQIKLALYNLRKAKAQVRLGLKAETDLANIQSDLEENKLLLIQEQNKRADAKAKLKEEMNLSPQKEMNIQQDSTENLVGGIVSPASDSLLYSVFVRYSPSVKIKQAALCAAQKNVAIARGKYWPKLTFEAEINSYYTNTNKNNTGHIIGFHDQLNQNQNKYLVATLSIPLFNHKQTRNEVQKAKIARTEAQIKLDQSKQELYYKISNTSRKLNELFREKRQSDRQVQANKLAYKTAQRKYDEGLIGIIDLLTTKEKLATAQSNRLSARLKWQINYRMIDFYRGIRFWETEASTNK